MIKAKGIIIADCAHKGLSLDVPQDLEEQLHVLNLSHNEVKNITNYSFDRYKNSLMTLDMSFLKQANETNKSVEFSLESFSILSKLEYLDLTNSCWSKKFTLPQTIRILRIENCSSILNISHLHLLEEFHAAGNEWNSSPAFHKLAPLKYIDLRRNALRTFDLQRIAPFCDLKILRLDIFPAKTFKKELHTEKTYCTCRAIDYWLTITKVEHDHWDCIPPDNGFAPKCDLAPGERVLKLRRQCLSKKTIKSLSTSSGWWMIAISLVIILSLLISALVMNGIKRALRRARARARNHPHSDDDEEEEDDSD
ncbi:uncharacterized protein LOC135834342 [Planococcus citri]|uniref:uncharacterized protein LOC135834342 n=1 Tax=Planococcus citri TaxID=170843 RepID=UPI0031F73020